MGRITVFGAEACPHCRRAKGALKARNIPFVDIDVAVYPERRKEMSAMANRVSLPQVFFNEKHVGGADDLVKVLEGWDSQKSKTAKTLYEECVASYPNPTDPRLALPPATLPENMSTAKKISPSTAALEAKVDGPDGVPLLAIDLIAKLDKTLDRQCRPYKAHWYKNSFVNSEALDVLAREYPSVTRKQLVTWLQLLQTKYELIHHVCDDHVFREDGYFFFRQQNYHFPDVLNSYIVWQKVVGKSVDPADATDLIYRLHEQLHCIISKHADDNGLTDYVKVVADPDFVQFEFATCELQEIDMGSLDDTTRKAFGMNLYNLFILYAFAKIGISVSGISRNAFFSRVRMNVGGHLLSFNDLEHGVLRANTRHPYQIKPAFLSSEDPRWHWSLAKLDHRLHFGLNCGAKSCPPIKFFNPKTLDEELDLVSQAFCETDDTVLVREEAHEVHLSMIFKWFQADFAESKVQLPKTIVKFLSGPKKDALQRMIERQTNGDKRPITIRFQAYDWSANASNYVAYNPSDLKANEYSATAMLRFHGHFNCMSAQTPAAVSVSG